jgi:hypothetical protein
LRLLPRQPPALKAEQTRSRLSAFDEIPPSGRGSWLVVDLFEAAVFRFDPQKQD